MEQDVLAGKLAEVDAQLAGVHAKLQSAAQMESAELDAAIAQTREETQLLFAEYAMDFAMQAARHALLVALEAIRDEQRKGSAAE